MIFLDMVLIILCFISIYSVVLNLYKRKQLGNIKMKVKLDIQSYLLIFLTIIACMGTAYFTVLRVVQYNSSNFYGVKEIIWVISNSILYTLLYLKIFLSITTSREVRDRGITLARGVINYSEIKSIYWLNEKKVQINYEPNYEPAFNRQFKGKWVVRDEQINELKRHLNLKNYGNIT